MPQQSFNNPIYIVVYFQDALSTSKLDLYTVFQHHCMNKAALIQEAEKALIQIFVGIDGQVKENLNRVLQSFRNHRVGTHHFSSVSGYGHDDLGRETLDKVFAELMGAEAAVVRVQFVSGTHAIACALYGVLRPGDEMLAVVGAPYDTLEEVIGVRGTGL
jgi:cystathionine beta-lyase family protein involved in aluminum resistance